jgi:hypothetical protein
MKSPLNSGQRFYEMEREDTKRFLGLSRHFTTIPTVALLVVIGGIKSLSRALQNHF